MAYNREKDRKNSPTGSLRGAEKNKNKKGEQEKPFSIRTGEYRRYKMKSGILSGEFVARAFLRSPTEKQSLVAEAKGETEEAAIGALREMIDSRDARRKNERRTAPQTGAVVPSTEEFVEAIGQISLSRSQCAMLVALALADGDGMTEKRMASAAGHKSEASAFRALARVGLAIERYLSVDEAVAGRSSLSDGASVLGFRGEPTIVDSPGNWILHSEFRDAVRFSLQLT